MENVLGLLISTLAAIIITISTLCDNIKFKKSKAQTDNVGEEVTIETSSKDMIIIEQKNI